MGKPCAAVECAVANSGQSSSSGKSNMGEPGAVLECVVANVGNPLRNCDVGDRILVWPHHVLGDDFRIFGEG